MKIKKIIGAMKLKDHVHITAGPDTLYVGESGKLRQGKDDELLNMKVLAIKPSMYEDGRPILLIKTRSQERALAAQKLIITTAGSNYPDPDKVSEETGSYEFIKKRFMTTL